MTNEPYLDDDGATEVVTDRPGRKPMAPIVMETIAQSPAGGRVRAMHAAGDAHRRHFILLRKVDQPAAKIALPHIHVFKAIWSVWSAKRVAGEADPGVSVAEIKANLLAQVPPQASSSVASAVRSLTRGAALRSTDVHVGFGARRVRYYPTDQGVQAFALAEVLGEGASVSIGRPASAWKNRSEAEPGSLFDYAALIRGGGDLDPAESA